MSEPVYHRLDIFGPDLVTAAADEIMKMVPWIPYGVTPNGGTPSLLFVFIDAQQTYLTPAQREAIASNLKAGRPLVGVIFLDKRDNQWTSCPAGDEHCRETYVQTRRREAFRRFMEGKFKVDVAMIGSPECHLCLGEGRVPVFKDQGGLSMPVGYRLCECVEEG